MADYFSQTIVQPSIPNACMTPLERWLLERMFESEADDDDTTYFFAAEGVSDSADANDDELQDILQADSSPLAAMVHDAIVNADDPDWLNLGTIGSAAVFQAIIARHPEQVPYVAIEMAFTCSKMRPDGFGGGAELITADEVRWINTGQWLAVQIKALPAPSGGGHA